MTKPSVLGRGLGNLIPGGNKNTSTGISDSGSGEVKDSNSIEIKISEIQMNPNQPRKTFSAETITEMAETIKVHGLIQPIIVKKIENGYELVAGERRLRACKEAGYIKIPAIIKNYSEKESIEIALLENIQREDLNPIEQAMAYQTISERLNLKITEVATRLGKNRSTIANLIRLLQLPESVKNLVSSGKLSEGHARPLLTIGDKKKLEEVAGMIVEKQMTVRQVEDYVSELVDGKNQENKKIQIDKDPSILDLEGKIRNKFSIKAMVQHNSKTGKGKISLSYNDMDELERLMEKMGIKI